MSGPAGRVRRLLKIERVESGLVYRCFEIPGAGSGSGQEVFKRHGSGRVALTRPDPREAVLTREKPS